MPARKDAMLPSLFSVSYAGLWGQHSLDPERFIEKAASLGYAGVQLMGKRPHLSVLDADETLLGRLRQASRRHGVRIASVAGYTDFTAGAQTPEVPLVEMQLAYVKRLAQCARALGASFVRVFTGYATDALSASGDWNTCVRAVREAAEICRAEGVVLGVQNHHDTAVATDSFAEFLNEVGHPNCRAVFDPWAPALHGEDLRRAAALLAPLMVQTTLADYVRLPRWRYLPGLVNYERMPDMMRAVPLGQGCVDLQGFFAGLRDGGFDGIVCYEMCSPLRGGGSEENLDACAKESLRVITNLIGASSGNDAGHARS